MMRLDRASRSCMGSSSELVGNGDLVVVDELDPLTEARRAVDVPQLSRLEVPDAAPGLAVVLLDGVDDPAMGDDEDGRPLVLRADAGERAHGPAVQHVLGLPARWPIAPFEIARPLGLDLLAGEAGPLAGVALSQVGLDHDRADTDGLGDDQRRVAGPLEIGGDDEVDRTHGLRRVLGLEPTEVAEWGIGLTLPAAGGVPGRLAVTTEEQMGHAGRR